LITFEVRLATLLGGGTQDDNCKLTHSFAKSLDRYWQNYLRQRYQRLLITHTILCHFQ